jgi:hypothetical protein
VREKAEMKNDFLNMVSSIIPVVMKTCSVRLSLHFCKTNSSVAKYLKNYHQFLNPQQLSIVMSVYAPAIQRQMKEKRRAAQMSKNIKGTVTGSANCNLSYKQKCRRNYD